ncbi:MAG TPA: carboxypeptidase M32 [Solirubrobacteraceae bacterium]|nr:carboxypeptidase M32 [Solirubrobacteraceae bacterium]
MSGRLDELKRRMARLSDLKYASSLANWDQQTKMPPRGAACRADVLATLAELRHREFTDSETGRLLDAAAGELRGADPDSDEVRLVESVRRHWEKARRVPGDLTAEIARAGSRGQEVWIDARAQSDFAMFQPVLQHNVDLARRYVECHLGHDGFQCAYDVLLDDYEPLMRTAQVAALFDELKRELLPLIDAVTNSAGVDATPVEARFPVEGQRALSREVVELMGFDARGWRLDDTVHPFATGVGDGDVRITTRYDERYWPMSLFGSMHECGHGLYEEGAALAHPRSPLGAVDSLAMHESQSRLWENMVGRGRSFANVLAPRAAAHCGGPLEGLEPEALFRAVNRVRPSFIRVEADEATYALHIILRFELEQELIEGTLRVADAAEAWRARFRQYVGLDVTDDADGILQDVHWSAGLMGYFSTYALGNLIAGQLWERAHRDLPDLEDALAAGELGGLREWLREHVHRHGAKFPTAELLQRELQAPISVAPFVRYLKDKLGDVYGLSL